MIKIFTLFILFLSFSSWGRTLENLEAIKLDDLGKKVTHKFYLQYDLPSTKFSTADLKDLKETEVGKEIELSYTNTATGFVFKLAPGQTEKDTVLHFNHTLSGKVELFKLGASGDWERVLITGSEIPYNERILKGYELAFPIQFDAEKETTYLLRRHSHHRFDAKVELCTKQEYIQSQTILQTYYFFYIGALFSLIFYNLFLYFASREKNYLYYCLFGFAISFTVMAMTGFIDNLFSFLNVSLSQHLILFSSSSLMTCILFARSFNNLDQITPRLVKVLHFIFGGTLFIFLAAIGPWDKFFGGAHLGTLIDIFIPLGVFLMIVGAFISYRKGNVMAKFYLVSWFFMFGGTFIYFAHYTKLLERNFLTSHSIMWGNVFEMIVVSLGLAYKIAILDREKKEALILARGKREYERLVRVLLHDIGNPLNLIKYYVSMKTKSPESFQKNEEKAWNKISLGTNKIKEIIEFHRDQEMNISKEASELKLEKISLEDIVEESKAIFEESLEFKQLSFEVEGSKPEGSFVLAERISLINEVLNNILSNAIKFSFEGGTIKLEILSSGDTVTLKVTDQGVGMTSDRLRQFNEKGSLSSQKGTSGEEGTGFGLYLAKSYMELYGGSLRVESTHLTSDRRNHGTSFHLNFNRC